MSGRIEYLSQYSIVIFSLAAASVDILRSKIPNSMTFFFMVFGFFLSTWFLGWTGLLQSFLGISACFLVSIPLYAFGWLGAGDIKFYMALGALGGWKYGLEVVTVSVILGGFFAFFVLLMRGQLPHFLAKVFRFLRARALRVSQGESLDFGAGEKFPFGIAIAAAALWSMVGHPLEFMGWRLW